MCACHDGKSGLVRVLSARERINLLKDHGLQEFSQAWHPLRNSRLGQIICNQNLVTSEN